MIQCFHFFGILPQKHTDLGEVCIFLAKIIGVIKMKKIIFLLIFVCFVKRMIFPFPVYAAETAGNSAVLVNMAETDELDIRTEQLKEFFDYYRSPLSFYSAFFVLMADKYGVDFRLVPAISGVESTFGKNIPFGSYNAYGWNGGKTKFDSWEKGIEEATKTLDEKYIKKGLNTPDTIAPVYCPFSKVWGRNVNFFMEKIDEFGERVTLLGLEPRLAG